MVRILVVSDVRFYREGLAQALSAAPDLDVTGTAANPGQALALVRSGGIDVVLLDLGMRDGLPLLHAIHEISPVVRVVALGVIETGSAILPWAEAGIAGYVARDSSLRELVDTVGQIAGGESPCAPHISAALFQRVAALARQHAGDEPRSRLTAREIEVVLLIARGLSNREIARALSIALPTVKNHVHNVLDKLRVRRRADAPHQLVNLGILGPPVVRDERLGPAGATS